MLRNIGKGPNEISEEARNKDKEDIFKKRIQREITKLQESKLIDGRDIYITINEQWDENEEKEKNASGVVLKKKYYYILGTFNESYFSKEHFFYVNFIEHIRNARKGNILNLQENCEDLYIFEELENYYKYKNTFCPFYNLFDALNFQYIFDNNFLTYLRDLNDFGNIFQTFKNAFVIEQHIYRTGEGRRLGATEQEKFLFFDKNENTYDKFSNEEGRKRKEIDLELDEQKERDSEERNAFYTNVFFEILYKDFTNHLSEIHIEVGDHLWRNDTKREETEGREEEKKNAEDENGNGNGNKKKEGNTKEPFSRYKDFFLFYIRYYPIRENVVFSYYVPDDYPFSKPFISVEHLPVSILNEKSQIRIMGDMYNRKNILQMLQTSEWLPKTTLDILLVESKNMVNKLFFYYQYKIYLFYYYLKKHKIFSLFFENHFRITFNCYNFIYSYVVKVDNRLATKQWKIRKRNYVYNRFSVFRNVECVNGNSLLYKMLYAYKQLKNENYGIKGSKKVYTGVWKGKCKRFLSFFSFLLFVIFPLVIKSFLVYKYNSSDEMFFFFNEHFFDDMKDEGNRVPMFHTVRTKATRDDALVVMLKSFEKNNTNEKKTETKRKINTEEEKGKEKRTDREEGIQETEKEEKVSESGFLKQNERSKEENNMHTESDVVIDEPRNRNESLRRNQDTDKSEFMKRPDAESTIYDVDELKKINKNRIRVILCLAISEFLFFSLGIMYNLRLLRKKNENFSFFINIFSSFLIFYNPVFFLNKQNHINILTVGLLYWSKNFLILKKMYWSVLCYFCSIYFNIRNINFFFPYLFIFVYMNSRIVRKIGNLFECRYKSKYQVVKYVMAYCSLFILCSYLFFSFFTLGRFSFFENGFFLTYMDFMRNYFYGYFKNVDRAFGASMWNQLHFVTRYMNGIFPSADYGSSSVSSVSSSRRSGEINNVSNSGANLIFSAFNYVPFFLIFLFNYSSPINTIMKFYSSIFLSSSLFLLLSSNATNALLLYIIVYLLLFINITQSFSIVLNILFSSYIIVKSSTFNLPQFVFSCLYFLSHIYLLHPLHKFSANMKYQILLIREILKTGARLLLSNFVYFHETCLKNTFASFVLLIAPVSFNNMSNEKKIESVALKMMLQKKILFCLYCHINHRYLFVPLSYLAFLLFLIFGFSKLYFSTFYFKLLSAIEFLIFLSILSILLMFYINRKNFSKLDFLSIPDSPKKRTFTVERSKKL